LTLIDSVVAIAASTIISIIIIGLIAIVVGTYAQKKLNKTKKDEKNITLEDYFNEFSSNLIENLRVELESKITTFEQKIPDLSSFQAILNEEKLTELISQGAYSSFMFILGIPEDQMENFTFKEYMADIFGGILGGNKNSEEQPSTNPESKTKAKEMIGKMAGYAVEDEIPGVIKFGLNRYWPDWQKEIQDNPDLGIEILTMAKQYGLFDFFQNFKPNSKAGVPRIISNQNSW